MAGAVVTAWEDVRAEMARRKVTVQEVAQRLGINYQRFSTISNTDSETHPTPEFAERVLAAISAAAAAKVSG